MKTRPWIPVTDLDDPSNIDADEAIQAASLILFQLSGQKYGGVQETTEQYFCESSGAPIGCQWDPGSSRWRNIQLGMYAWPTEPSRSSNRLFTGTQFRLKNRPVRAIVSIEVGGITVDSGTYNLLDGEILVRGGNWGVCDAPVVTYEFGVRPPALGRMAARRLANELVLAASGSENCALPSNVTSVSRQGMSFDIFDPQEFMDKGHTGLYEVDLFLAVSNPAKAKKRPKVFNPDHRRGYRPTQY